MVSDTILASRDRRAAVPAKIETARRLLAALATMQRRPARFELDRAKQRTRAWRIAIVGQPDLRLRHVGRHVAGNARHVLVEDVRANAGLVQSVGHEIRVEALPRDVDADHGCHSASATTSRSRTRDSAAARSGSKASGRAASM